MPVTFLHHPMVPSLSVYPIIEFLSDFDELFFCFSPIFELHPFYDNSDVIE